MRWITPMFKDLRMVWSKRVLTLARPQIPQSDLKQTHRQSSKSWRMLYETNARCCWITLCIATLTFEPLNWWPTVGTHWLHMQTRTYVYSIEKFYTEQRMFANKDHKKNTVEPDYFVIITCNSEKKLERIKEKCVINFNVI